MAIQYSAKAIEAMKKAEALVAEHSQAIGELCISWAALDHAIDKLLEPLLNLDRATVVSITSSLDRMEPRLQIAKKLLVQTGLSDQWQKWFHAVFTRVSDELAPLRNRYVHDRWHMRRGEMQRVERGGKVAIPQARQPRRLVFDSEHITPAAEVDRLRSNVDTVTYAIEIATYDLGKWRNSGRPPRLRKLLIPASTRRTRMTRFPMLLVWNGEQLPPYEYVTDP